MSRFRLVLASSLPLALCVALVFQQRPGRGANPDPPEPDGLGYNATFEAELKKIGQISPDEFARRYPGSARYIPGLSWDPTSAKFFDRFDADPAKDVPPPEPGVSKEELFRRQIERIHKGRGGKFDFRLEERERQAFKKYGFVVSERLNAPSFAEQFYRVFGRDLPVYFSTDAALHAWHRSFDAILEQLESTYLLAALEEILAGMAGQLPAAQRRYGAAAVGEGLADADYFLAVARSLLAGQPVKSTLGQDRRVNRTLTACDNEKIETFVLFGRDRRVDFSQFKARGHYENSEELKRYFRAMMWCGRIDLRVAGSSKESSPRELATAIVLYDLLVKAGKMEQWRQFDQLLQTFVGRTDSMTFAQLGQVLNQAKLTGPEDVRDEAGLVKLQGQIQAGKFGLQEVRGDLYCSSPFGLDKAELPRSFTLLGQRFVLDSWALSKVVADDVFWDGRKVQRRVPSGLDMAFAVLGNDQVVPELTARMKDDKGRAFRDGLNYQHNLAAVRETVEKHTPLAWEGSLHAQWLSCLRTLSTPTTDAKYPEVMRTKAWSRKSLNTQLASWSQLRHDTMLYVKQSYTAEVSCFYPDAFVEPNVAFWKHLEQMAASAAERLEKTTFPDRMVRGGGAKLEAVQKQQVEFLKQFAARMKTLHGIAQKELEQKELDKEEVKFLQGLIKVDLGCGGPPTYSGWYAGLFYGDWRGCGKADYIVADVHTNPPAPDLGDPGCVLHQGLGKVDLMLIAVDNGRDRVAYAGPVFSHQEFEMPGVTRRSDSEWAKEIEAGRLPPRPAWTKGWLVPKAR